MQPRHRKSAIAVAALIAFLLPPSPKPAEAASSLPFNFTFSVAISLDSREFTIPQDRDFRLAIRASSPVGAQRFNVELYRLGCVWNSCSYFKGANSFTSNNTLQSKFYGLGLHSQGTYIFRILKTCTGCAANSGSGTASVA